MKLLCRMASAGCLDHLERQYGWQRESVKCTRDSRQHTRWHVTFWTGGECPFAISLLAAVVLTKKEKRQRHCLKKELESSSGVGHERFASFACGTANGGSLLEGINNLQNQL